MGASRFTRTQKLAAAHALLVVSSYFEALGNEPSPLELRELALKPEERAALATGGLPADDYRNLLDLLINRRLPIPEPHVAFDDTCRQLLSLYKRISERLLRFIRGLSLWDQIDETRQYHIASALHGPIAERALKCYQESCHELAADSPEFEVWLSFTLDRSLQHQIGRVKKDIEHVSFGLAGLELILLQMATLDTVARPRILTTRSYRASLNDAIAPSRDLPEGVVVPTLNQAYVNPMCKVAEINQNDSPANNEWWNNARRLPSLELFLAGYLTSPRATSFPLIIFGQPGSGKSKLTEIVAARLPESDYLPIRVALREVAAENSIQAQIEQSFYLQVGEHVSWRDVVDEAKQLLPVVLLDGFDELLQATGINRTDYLDEIREFQQREERLGYPVVVIVTSRMAVADRMDIPPQSIALRLEPFNDAQIASWLKTWEKANVDSLKNRQIQPLPLETALKYRGLAEQPLLLLMLALYDAEENALQRSEIAISQTDLYEALIMSFASREARRLPRRLSGGDLTREAQKEVNNLALVALAMFTRHRTLVYEPELNLDLPILNPSVTGTGQHSHSWPSPAQLVISKFFFVHKSEARSSRTEVRSYEFMHSTFGEFLIAWLVNKVLSELAEIRSLNMRLTTTSVSPLDDGYLYAILSFASLTERRAFIDFLVDLLDRLTPDERRLRQELLADLLRMAALSSQNRSYTAYEPESLTIIERYATYSANLATLFVLCRDTRVTFNEIFSYSSDSTKSWREHTLLWKGSLRPEGWSGIRTLLESMHVLDFGDENFNHTEMPFSLSSDVVDLITEVKITRDVYLTRLLNVLSPYIATVGEGVGSGRSEPAVQRLISLWCGIGRDAPEDRVYKYISCFDMVNSLSDGAKKRYVDMLSRLLAIEGSVLPPELMLNVLDRFIIRGEVIFAERIVEPESSASLLASLFKRREEMTADQLAVVREFIEQGFLGFPRLPERDETGFDPVHVAEAWLVLAEAGVPLDYLVRLWDPRAHGEEYLPANVVERVHAQFRLSNIEGS